MFVDEKSIVVNETQGAQLGYDPQNFYHYGNFDFSLTVPPTYVFFKKHFDNRGKSKNLTKLLVFPMKKKVKKGGTVREKTNCWG